MAEQKGKIVSDQSFESLAANDSDLKVLPIDRVLHSTSVLQARSDFAELTKRWRTPASAESLAATVKALESHKHKVSVVDTPAAALKIVSGQLSCFFVFSCFRVLIGVFVQMHWRASRFAAAAQ